MNIEDLVIKAKHGDKDAYSELIKSIQGNLYRIARSKLNNESDSQDVVQDTVIKAYLNLGKLRINKNFKTWIIRILINECNKFYRKSKRRDEIFDKYAVDANSVTYMEDTLDLANIIKVLNDKEKKIFELYVDGYSIKQISKKLGINENTVKTNLSRSKVKLRRTYSPASIFMFILCVFVATSVIAVSIISYIKSLFELNSVGIDNDGVLMAIENMDWYQKVDMDYIDLGDGYKIKMEYLLMDEMNLYMVFDFTSEKDISKFNDIALPDLRIADESGNVICDEVNMFDKQFSNKLSIKSIENNKHNIKSLVYMYTDSFPNSKTLDISFSKVMLSKKSILSKNKYLNLTANANFKVTLSEKFTNRNYTSYSSDSDKIEKAIISETGFHSIIISNNESLKGAKLIDEFGNSYECYTQGITDFNYKYIINSNFNNIHAKILKLIVDNTEYILTIQK